MNPNDNLTVPRRSLDIEDYVDILRRHRGWILGPAFAGLVASVVVACLWPNSYVSSGMIRTQPAMVPQNLVATNVSEDLTQRIQATNQFIRSRPNLTNLIQTHNLYQNVRKSGALDDAVDKMMGDISLVQVDGGRAGFQRNSSVLFRISFTYPDKRMAQKICSDLVSRFIDDSVRQRSQQSFTTTQFLQDSVDIAKKELEEVEGKIAQFRMQNPGELPEQEQQLLSRQAGWEASVSNLGNQISRLRSDIVVLEAQLRSLNEQAQQTQVAGAPGSSPSLPGAPVRNERLAQVERQIQAAETQLMVLRESYRDSHPEVQRLISYLGGQQKVRDQLLAEAEISRPLPDAAKPRGVPQAVPTERALAARSEIPRVQAQIASKNDEIELFETQIKDLRGKIQLSQAKINSSPASQQQYFQLLREHELKKVTYNDLTARLQKSSLSTELENRKQGDTLEIVEQPNLPSSPSYPQRPLIVAGGLALGIGLGLALAAGRELKDTSLKNLKDVRAYTKLNILGSIPLLENDFVVRRRRRLAWLAWSAGFMLGILLMAGSVLYYVTSNV